MKILFVLGARSEWGYIKPVIDCAISRGHRAEIFACNTSIINRFGHLDSEIEANKKYVFAGKFFTAFDGDNKVSMSKSLGSVILSATDWLVNNKYDWIIIAGDRVEQLGFTIAAGIMYIPIGHIQAGERSGNIDGISRHAIARFAHLHFASNEDAATRLKKSGEESFRIHLTGAPQLDELVSVKLPDIKELVNRRIIKSEKYIIAVLHGSTDEIEMDKKALSVIEVLHENETSIVWIAANNDEGKFQLEEVVKRNIRIQDSFHTNLNRLDYLSLLRNCKFIIGNSSSGLLEAPTFSTPAINLGIRQSLRFRGLNVIDCDFDKKEIREAIIKVINPKFKDKLKKELNPYGDGQSSEKIVTILEQTMVNHRFLTKKITY
jgi:GDP/UDP-N,N'-diacetylbacillosamine 2-epimerase (hydrolysing)